MQPVHINLKETSGIKRRQEPIRLGIPFKKSSVSKTTVIGLKSAGGQPLPLQLTPTSYWPDGSYRWATVTTAVDLAANTSSTLVLQTGELNQSASSHWDANELIVTSGNNTFELFGHTLGWQRVSEYTSQTYPTQVEMRVANATVSDELLSSVLDKPWQCVEDGPVSTVLSTQGYWKSESGQQFARFTCTLNFYHGNSTLSVQLCIHNPKRAKHHGGLWDLGDPGSISFNSLTVRIACPDLDIGELSLTPSKAALKYNELPLKIYQDSSGGENWNSRNHVDKNGEITTQFRGFKVTEQNKAIEEGHRASPTLRVAGGADTNTASNRSIQIAYPLFWQNFPSALEATENEMIVHLFPARKNQQYELQGGERKTQTVLISYGVATEPLAWAHEPLTPTLQAQHYQDTDAFPWFCAVGNDTTLNALINSGLEGSNNFFAKREKIDEYGWRNFGEIFADHETLYQAADEEPFISHYNNQYDAIYGFARQFALSGDPRWFQLMDNLAHHVADIDIYHTEVDRAEYNNGLFWHTDHYLDTYTATHRTFSRHNDTSSTPGQTGGGPAAEHCYTTGLLYHYFLTGSTTSKTAVLKLAGWMVATHEGTGGFLESLLAVKNQDIPKLKALAKGQHVTTHRYPFTRGTGNYLTALIDASILEPDNAWLSKADTVIRATIHPKDNIAKRNLLDVEISWSYLILLSAIARYLNEKRAIGQLDSAYQYAASSFMAYAEWMHNNEKPFLANPEQLEFPNHTWVAQDIRKAMLMFQAAEFAPKDQENHFQKTGKRWLIDTSQILKTSEEREFSRVLIILMQNYGPHLISAHSKHASIPQITAAIADNSLRLTWSGLLSKILLRLGKGICNFSPAREKNWLNARLNR
ncbi:hypothetical protein SAMN05216369_2148 [Marinobacter antarcticus]|uniref:PcRGLX/YetA-like N-terminal RIFT barrel domain-containing protein n=1 Tax=Marinobacter antarcticus TaxID=564117 RepID=A0A1M6SNE3_9GAMM|nr:hypothetical protein [Marinobacter antarcticus]SHK46157.1 hypothetical protein SAMN05216369_2148 [Marinobacter antarcticus]